MMRFLSYRFFAMPRVFHIRRKRSSHMTHRHSSRRLIYDAGQAELSFSTKYKHFRPAQKYPQYIREYMRLYVLSYSFCFDKHEKIDSIISHFHYYHYCYYYYNNVTPYSDNVLLFGVAWLGVGLAWSKLHA